MDRRWRLLLQTVVAMVLAAGITSLASLFFRGEVGSDYVITGIVAAALINTVIETVNQRLRDANAVLEQQVAQRTAELDAARTAAAVAHEVKNPLAAILGNLELVEELLGGPRSPEDDAELARSARSALLAARHLQALVRDLRQDGEEDGPVDVAQVAEEAARLARPYVDPIGRVELGLDGLPPARVNRSRLVQVLLNLLVNAALASRPGVENVIRVTGRLDGRRLLVTVADCGAGMTSEVLARVFEPGFTTRAEKGGSGLGLSIVRGIVESGHGSIDVSTRLGEGTEVRLWLPTERAA